MSNQPLCELCGKPMPEGEEMFKYHGYSGSCPRELGVAQAPSPTEICDPAGAHADRAHEPLKNRRPKVITEKQEHKYDSHDLDGCYGTDAECPCPLHEPDKAAEPTPEPQARSEPCGELFIGASDHFAETCALPKGHKEYHSSKKPVAEVAPAEPQIIVKQQAPFVLTDDIAETAPAEPPAPGKEVPPAESASARQAPRQNIVWGPSLSRQGGGGLKAAQDIHERFGTLCGCHFDDNEERRACYCCPDCVQEIENIAAIIRYHSRPSSPSPALGVLPSATDLELELCRLRQKVRAADAMAKVADDWVERGEIDSRSALADARLNYGRFREYEPESVGMLPSVEEYSRLIAAINYMIEMRDCGHTHHSAKFDEICARCRVDAALASLSQKEGR